MTICSVTMAGVTFFELLDISDQPLEYIKEAWNWFDIGLIITWYTLFGIEAANGFKYDLYEHGKDYVPEFTNHHIRMNILRTIVVILSFMKILFFMRAYEGFSSLIMMLKIVLKDLLYL